jgi:hypothetical protein
MVHASYVSTDVVAREGRPGRHVRAAGNLAAITDDESYHGSNIELPPATSHGYTEWDLLTVRIRQPSHEFTFCVAMTFVSYPLVLTPVV